MPIGKEIEHRSHILGFKEAISRAASSDDQFFTWFDSAKDKETAFVRGSWDFMYHIALPVSAFVSWPEDMIALEIGYGGGRILAAASRYFKYVIGVDIHEEGEKVENELKRRGIDNYRLVKTRGNNLPLESASVDLVYSFIVMQHIEKMEIFRSYLFEIHRVLKPAGIAVLYFGRKCVLSHGKTFKCLYYFDRFMEQVLLPRGFLELPVRVNEINLIVSLSHAKSLMKGLGFNVLDSLVSRKKVPDGIKHFGLQNGLVVRKR